MTSDKKTKKRPLPLQGPFKRTNPFKLKIVNELSCQSKLVVLWLEGSTIGICCTCTWVRSAKALTTSCCSCVFNTNNNVLGCQEVNTSFPKEGVVTLCLAL